MDTTSNVSGIIGGAMRNGYSKNLDCALFQDTLFTDALPLIAQNLRKFVLATNQSNLLEIISYMYAQGFKITDSISIKDGPVTIHGIEFRLNELNDISNFTAPQLLLAYTEKEVAYRLKEHHGLSDDAITEDVIGACVYELDADSDVMFDYDAIDNVISSVLSSLGIDPLAGEDDIVE